MNLDSLPDRPISSAEVDALDDADSISDSFIFVEHGSNEGRFVFQFALDLDGEYVGLHFDPFAEKWEVAGRSTAFEDVSTSLADARND